MESRIVFLTGEIGTGKTTLCLEAARLAQEGGRSLGGVVSPPVFKDGEKTAIEVKDLKTGAVRTLAVRKKDPDSEGFSLCWDFDQEVLAWANQAIAAAPPCDVFFLDELGPLEFEHGRGWTAGFDVLKGEDYQLAVVVIRPSLLAAARERWPEAETFQADRGAPVQRQAARLLARFPLDS